MTAFVPSSIRWILAVGSCVALGVVHDFTVTSLVVTFLAIVLVSYDSYHAGHEAGDQS